MRTIFISALVGLFLPKALFAQPNSKSEIATTKVTPARVNGFEITGQFKGLEEGEKVILTLLSPPGWDMKSLDSCYVKNGVFHFSGIVPDEGPREYLINFSRNMTGFDLHKFRTVTMVIGNGENITLKCDTNISKILTRGIIDEYVFRDGAYYDRSVRAIFSGWYFYIKAIDQLKNKAQKMVDSVGFDGPALTEIYESIDVVSRAFWSEVFNAHPDQFDEDLAIAYLIFTDGVARTCGHAPFLAEQYNRLSEKERNSYYGRQLALYASLSIGKPMPEFSLPGMDGKLISLKSITQMGKMTLVNFWGSNSPLVKSAHSELKNIYKQFHGKGLNIIAVSSDDYKEVWEDAVANGNYPWYNVLDKKGHIVDSVYNEYGYNKEKLRNVTNVLLDAEGKIVAWDVNGAELQWYLWKYLDAKK